jgi:hypothetical protein
MRPAVRLHAKIVTPAATKMTIAALAVKRVKKAVPQANTIKGVAGQTPVRVSHVAQVHTRASLELGAAHNALPVATKTAPTV